MAAKEIEGLSGLRDFLVLWKKFHDLYTKALGGKIISRGESEEFLKTQEVIGKRYHKLLKRLKYNPQNNPIDEILQLRSLESISDDMLSALEDKWKGSFALLENWLTELEDKSKRKKKGFLSRFFGGSK